MTMSYWLINSNRTEVKRFMKNDKSIDGFFAVISVGMLFQNKANTLMEEPENQKFRILIY